MTSHFTLVSEVVSPSCGMFCGSLTVKFSFSCLKAGVLKEGLFLVQRTEQEELRQPSWGCGSPLGDPQIQKSSSE